MIKDVIAPIFKDLRFKKKTNNFQRITEDLMQIFNVQKSQWNSKEDISFTFNLGFLNKDIFEKSFQKPAPDVPKEYDWFISLRSGLLTPKYGKWDQLNDDIPYDKLYTDIKDDLQKSAVPLLNLSIIDLIN